MIFTLGRLPIRDPTLSSVMPRLQGHKEANQVRAGECGEIATTCVHKESGVAVRVHGSAGDSRIGTELSHSPRHSLSIVHLRCIEEHVHWREAKGLDAAHRLVFDDPTALGHEDEVDFVLGVTLDEREAVDDGHVNFGGVVRATGNDDSILTGLDACGHSLEVVRLAPCDWPIRR
jgi:hypothetical protein